MGFFARAMAAIGYVPRAGAVLGYGGRAYEAGRSDSRELGGWNPGLGHPDNEVLATRDKITARARDLDRNHPVISGALDRREEKVVGSNIRLEYTPDFEALGGRFDADWADAIATSVEARFRVWGRDIQRRNDVERHQTFGMQVATAYRHWWRDGEACAAIFDTGNIAGNPTAVRLIDPDRLSNPNGLADNSRLPNGNRVVGGVEINADGAAIAYHVRVRHPAATGTDSADSFRWERILRWNPRTGRPRFVHAYKRNRAEQRRNVSRMVASMRKTRMFDRYDDAELEAALFNAVNGFWVESPYPTAEVRDAMSLAPGSDDASGWSLEKQVQHRADNKVSMGGGVRVFHGLPGEKIGAVSAERPNRNYPDFQATGLRSIAAQFGLSYPELAQNWADINYSSARTLLNEIWRGLLDDRWQFTQLFCSPIAAAWLEMDVALGLTTFGAGTGVAWFYRNRSALLMFEWFGPGRGTVDPLKEAKAADSDQAAGRTNLSILAAEQGYDPWRIMQGQVRDRARRKKLGLPEPTFDKAAAGEPGEDKEDGNGRREPAGEAA